MANKKNNKKPHKKDSKQDKKNQQENAEKDLLTLSGRDFAKKLASKDAIPGGGGAAAYVGAIGTALGRMTAALSLEKQAEQQDADDLKALSDKAKQLQEMLEDLVTKDAEAFKPLAACYKLPSDTATEMLVRRAAIQGCLSKCADVPLSIMKACVVAIHMQEEFAEKATSLALSDAGCGAIMLKGALQAAALNVAVNTKEMDNRDAAKKFDDEAEKLLAEGCVAADAVYASVSEKLKRA